MTGGGGCWGDAGVRRKVVFRGAGFSGRERGRTASSFWMGDGVCGGKPVQSRGVPHDCVGAATQSVADPMPWRHCTAQRFALAGGWGSSSWDTPFMREGHVADSDGVACEFLRQPPFTSEAR